MIKLFFTRQFLEFLLVGGLAAFLNWLSRLLFSQLMPFWLAVIFAYGVGLTVAFFLNSHYVFSSSIKTRGKQARDFLIVNGIAFPIVWMASIFFNIALIKIGMVNYTEEIAHGLALGLPVLISFIAYKFFAFADFHK